MRERLRAPAGRDSRIWLGLGLPWNSPGWRGRGHLRELAFAAGVQATSNHFSCVEIPRRRIRPIEPPP